MSGNSLNPRFGVFILSGGQATEQERHCTQAILEHHGSTAGVFQFPDYQALFDAAAAEQLDAVICDIRELSIDERYFAHLLGEVLWYRYGLCLHHLDAPDTHPVNPIYQQLLTRILLTAYGDPELGVIQPQPFGYVRVNDRQQPIPAQSEALEGFISRYAADEAQE
jgi:hypothetical protein